jgi:hypothetical protein
MARRQVRGELFPQGRAREHHNALALREPLDQERRHTLNQLPFVFIELNDMPWRSGFTRRHHEFSHFSARPKGGNVKTVLAS